MFFYFGSYIPDRDALIEDGDSEEGNDCEQSDLVIILLNLGAIPDQIAQAFEFEPGFKTKFIKKVE